MTAGGDQKQIVPREAPTMYFVGVTTGQSAIQTIFPRWAEILSLADAQLEGVDLPLHAPPEAYRQVVAQIREDPLSLGALVTSHKLDLLAAARDLFDELDRYARLCDEISCIAKHGGKVVGRAFDPVTAGIALEKMAGPGYWRERAADVLCLGAGGAGVALTTYLADRRPAGDRPRRLVLVDVDGERLRSLRALVQALAPAGMAVAYVHNRDPAENERLLGTLSPGSLVVNATGMGKDIPGSPLPRKARFPRQGIVWELNYRGPRPFYRRALVQAESRSLQVVDGWDYFLIGWAEIIGEVFGCEISAEAFAQMAAVAERMR